MNTEKLVWTEDISVNNEKFNVQHKNLFEIINELGEEPAETNPEEYARLLSCLIDYFRTHFAAEEAYMEHLGYPDLKIHHTEHSRLMYDITMFNLNYTHHVPTKASELQKFMKDKFFNHILNFDLSYRNFEIRGEDSDAKINIRMAY